MAEPKVTTYIGIDPGYAITGYGIIRKTGNKLTAVDYGVIETKPSTDFPLRLLTINERIRYILELYKPDYMSVEELFISQNRTTAVGTAQARGVVLVEAARANIPVYEFTPGQVKLAVTGYGKAEKKQVQTMVKSLLGLKEIPKPDDAADLQWLSVLRIREPRMPEWRFRVISTDVTVTAEGMNSVNRRIRWVFILTLRER